MGIRDQLARNRALAIGIAVAFVVVGIGGVSYQISTSATTVSRPSQESQAFFTTDDGQTWFPAPASTLAPFDHDDKPAVRAYVFQCDGKKFTGYLERYTPDALKAMATAKSAKPDLAGIQQAQVRGREIKRPGDKDWVAPFGQAGAKVMAVQCPGGGGTPAPVEP